MGLCSLEGFLIVEAINLNDLLGDIPGLLEVFVFNVRKGRIENLFDVERGAALKNGDFVSSEDVFDLLPRMVGVYSRADRIKWVKLPQ